MAKPSMSPRDHILVNAATALVTIGFPHRDNEAMLLEILADAVRTATAEAPAVRRVLEAADFLLRHNSERGAAQWSADMRELEMSLHHFAMWRLGEAQDVVRRRKQEAEA